MPAALKWLVLGTIAWLLWRVPIVARDFLRLQQQATSALPLPGKAPAQGELPLPITEKNQAADSITIAAKSAYPSILPNMRRHSGKRSAIVFALPPPLPTAPERMAEKASPNSLPPVHHHTHGRPTRRDKRRH